MACFLGGVDLAGWEGRESSGCHGGSGEGWGFLMGTEELDPQLCLWGCPILGP